MLPERKKSYLGLLLVVANRFEGVVVNWFRHYGLGSHMSEWLGLALILLALCIAILKCIFGSSHPHPRQAKVRRSTGAYTEDKVGPSGEASAGVILPTK